MNGLKTWRVVRCCRKCGNPVKRDNRKTYHARRVFRKARGHR